MAELTRRAIVGIARHKGREAPESVAARFGTTTVTVRRVWACLRKPGTAAAEPGAFDDRVQVAMQRARVLAREYGEPAPVTLGDSQVVRAILKDRPRVTGRNGDIVFPKRPGQRVRGKPLLVRIPVEDIAAIDEWRAEMGVSRAEVIRRLVAEALGGRDAG